MVAAGGAAGFGNDSKLLEILLSRAVLGDEMSDKFWNEWLIPQIKVSILSSISLFLDLFLW